VSLVIPDIWDFGKGAVKAEPKQENDPNIYFRRPTNYHHRLYRLKEIKQLIQDIRPNVIYLEGDPGSVMSALLGNQAKRYNILFFALSCENLSQNPLAVAKREGIGQLLNAGIKYSLIQFARKKIDTLFVINNQGLEYFKQLGFKNVVKTPLGFNEKVFRIDLDKRRLVRKELGVNENTIIISYFGRLVYEKGVHLLIEALEKLPSQNWIFLIDEFSRYKTDYQTKIETMIDNSNFKHKTIFFEADHNEIANYMNASDITVLPSIPTKKWVEQYGRVVPEAMACGNRLIVSNVGAQNDFFESGYSFQYPPESIDELVRLLEIAIKEFKNGQFDRNKYASVAQENFNLNAQLGVFKKLLKT
jgi:glycosyltransferase involved in cell wall biosynthesis